MRFTIKAKLALAFLTVLALLAGSMFTAIGNLASLNEALSNLVQGNAKRISIAEEMNARTLRIARDEKNHMLSNTPEEFQQYREAIAKEDKAIREEISQLRGLSSEEGKRRIDAFSVAWDAFMVKHNEVEKYAELNSGVEARQKAQEAGKLRTAIMAAYEPILQRLATVASTSSNPQDFNAFASLKELDASFLAVALAVRRTIVTMDEPAQQEVASRDARHGNRQTQARSRNRRREAA